MIKATDLGVEGWAKAGTPTSFLGSRPNKLNDKVNKVRKKNKKVKDESSGSGEDESEEPPRENKKVLKQRRKSRAHTLWRRRRQHAHR